MHMFGIRKSPIKINSIEYLWQRFRFLFISAIIIIGFYILAAQLFPITSLFIFAFATNSECIIVLS